MGGNGCAETLEPKEVFLLTFVPFFVSIIVFFTEGEGDRHGRIWNQSWKIVEFALAILQPQPRTDFCFLRENYRAYMISRKSSRLCLRTLRSGRL